MAQLLAAGGLAWAGWSSNLLLTILGKHREGEWMLAGAVQAGWGQVCSIGHFLTWWQIPVLRDERFIPPPGARACSPLFLGYGRAKHYGCRGCEGAEHLPPAGRTQLKKGD